MTPPRVSRPETIVRIATIGALAVPVIIMLGAPLAAAAGWQDAASLFSQFFRKICHQQADRSFTIAGNPLAACARCCGVWTGLLAGAVLMPLVPAFAASLGTIRRGVLVALVAPAVLHAPATWLGLAPDWPWLRAGTAFVAAGAVALLVAATALELVRSPNGRFRIDPSPSP